MEDHTIAHASAQQPTSPICRSQVTPARSLSLETLRGIFCEKTKLRRCYCIAMTKDPNDAFLPHSSLTRWTQNDTVSEIAGDGVPMSILMC